jgi:hypothetical protein
MPSPCLVAKQTDSMGSVLSTRQQRGQLLPKPYGRTPTLPSPSTRLGHS